MKWCAAFWINAAARYFPRSAYCIAVSFLMLVGCGVATCALANSPGGPLPDACTCLALYFLAALAVARFVRSRILAVVLIMAASLLLHIAVLVLTRANFDQAMASDFIGPAVCISESKTVAWHNPLFFYWCNYEFVCSVLGDLFGRGIVVGQALNMACCVLAIPPVFVIAERIGGFFAAVFTAIFMGSAPFLLIYSTILTNEFVATFFYVYFFYFLLECAEDIPVKKVLLNAVPSGLCLGLGLLFKPVFAIFACTMAFGLFVMICSRRKAKIVSWVLACLVICLVSRFSSGVVQACMSEIAKPRVLRQESGSTLLIRSILIGLHRESNGQWYLESSDLETKSEEELKALLKERVKRDFMSYPQLFLRKLNIVYASPDWMVWYNDTIAPKTAPAWVQRLVNVWHKAFWILFMMGSAGLIVAFCAKRGNTMTGLLLLATIGAFTAAILLIEGQPRYKTSFYPLFFLVVPYASVWLEGQNPVYGFLCRGARRTFSFLKDIRKGGVRNGR